MDACKSLEKQSASIDVLLLVGGYRGESYEYERIQWLERSLEDLCRQTLKPSQVLVSVNSNVGQSLERVKDLILRRFPKAWIYCSTFDRTALRNFETLLQVSKSHYVCFWSDHDIHAPAFLEECLRFAQSSHCALACPTIHYFYSDDNSKARQESCTPFCSVSAVSLSENLIRYSQVDAVGSIYGLWVADHLKRLPFVEIRSLDFLWQILSQIASGCVFFESTDKLISLREYRYSRASNHEQLVDALMPFSSIAAQLYFSPVIYVMIQWLNINLDAMDARRVLVAVRKLLRNGVGFWNIKRPLLMEIRIVLMNKSGLLQKIAALAYVIRAMSILSRA